MKSWSTPVIEQLEVRDTEALNNFSRLYFNSFALLAYNPGEGHTGGDKPIDPASGGHQC